MEKREQILREIGEAPDNSPLYQVFDELDKYQLNPPPMEATKQLIQQLKPILAQETASVKREERFKEILANAQRSNSLPVILQLVGPQTALMSEWFVVGTIVFLILGIMLSSSFETNSLRFLIAVSPFLGLLTLLHEYRAQIYKVEEMEAACRYSPAQVATARIIVVLGYNVVLGTTGTLLIGSANIVIWKLIINWLGPLLLILGIALAASVKLGVLGGCMTAATVWLAQLTLMEGGSFLQLLIPNLTSVASDITSMFMGIGLIYFTLLIWRLEARLPRTR